MKTKLLKRLRKITKKTYIIASNYPGFEIFYYHSVLKYYRWYRSYSNFKEAIQELYSLRNEKLKDIVSILRNKQINKKLRKL